MTLEDLPIGIVDLVVIAIVLISGLFAYFRGFVKEVLSILSWVGAGAATIYLYTYAIPYAAKLVATEPFTTILASVAVFIAALIALSIVSSIISGSIRESGAGPIDKALGFVFGLARGAIVVSLLYIGMTWVWNEDEFPEMIAEAKALPAAKFGADFLISIAPQDIRDRARSAEDEAKRTIEQGAQAQKIYESLNNPSPSGESAASNEQPAYGETDRTRLDSLVEQTQ